MAPTPPPSKHHHIAFHPALSERPLVGGVGFEVWLVAAVLVGAAVQFAGPLSVPTLVVALVVTAGVLFIRAVLRRDAFAIEALIAGHMTPRRFEAHPRPATKTRRARPSIPKRFL